MQLTNNNRAKVLAALYNSSKPQGMGFLHFDPKPMTEEEADELLVTHHYFDYLKGRIMKVDLGGTSVDFFLYDRDNGVGAGERACKELDL